LPQRPLISLPHPNRHRDLDGPAARERRDDREGRHHGDCDAGMGAPLDDQRRRRAVGLRRDAMTAPPAPSIDFLAGDFYGAHAAEAYAWMRRNAPVYFDVANELWGIATYDGVVTAGRDAATFSNAGGSRPNTGPLPWMMDTDGAAHRTRHKLVS